jgi:hypothetical protein
MTQKPGEENATAKPQHKSKMKQTWKPLSKALEVVTDTTDNEDTAKQTSKAQWISWTPARTECLLDWLDENPIDWQKLFSDSSKDAKEEGWWKCVAKGTKSEFHKMIATFIFSADADAKVHLDLSTAPGNYMKFVDNYLLQCAF